MTRTRDGLLPPAFDDLNVGITVHDPDTGAVLDVNERLEEIYGYGAAELRQMEVGDYTAPSTKFSQDEAVRRIRAAADGDPQEFEWQIERSNGELRWVRVSLDSTSFEGRPYVVAEIADVTDYRRREQRLRLLSRIVRHNLRNEMNVVQGHANRLESAVEDDEAEESVEQILDTAIEVGGLSESVREIERIAEPDAAALSSTSLRRVVTASAEAFRSECPAVDLTMEVEADVSVVADEGVEYAVDEAFENAIVHNDRDEPSVRVTVTEDPDARQGVVRIADDGPPIPDHEIDVLGEDVVTSSTYHGTGAGLWVMQWCVTSLGGELAFEENEPRGNVVSIALPMADGETEFP